MKQNILLTGMPRSGSTWVGRILAAAPKTAYVHEPFNVSNPCPCGFLPNEWFYYVTAERTVMADRHLRHLIERPFSRDEMSRMLRAALRNKRIRSLVQWFRTIGADHTIVKAPNAPFSAEWLAKRWNMRVIVLVRHPAAIAYRWKRIGWTVEWDGFLSQPELLKGSLRRFREEIHEFAQIDRPIIEQVALLWKLVYSTLDDARRNNPDWIFIRHEDLAMAPGTRFPDLYRRLGLPVTSTTLNAIETLNTVRGHQGSYDIRRDSSSTTRLFRENLTQAEVAQIRERVGGAAGKFYEDASW